MSDDFKKEIADVPAELPDSPMLTAIKKTIDFQNSPNYLFKVDVTMAGLSSYRSVPYIDKLLGFLREFWVGEYSERETDTRIGSVEATLSEDGEVRINFTTRFVLNAENQQQLKEAIADTRKKHEKEFARQLQILRNNKK